MALTVATPGHCKGFRCSYLLLDIVGDTAMKTTPINTLFDGAAEIVLPHRFANAAQPAAACICCGRADQSMDDDGCGICDACLDAPLQATGNPDGLDFPDAFAHLSLTARHR